MALVWAIEDLCRMAWPSLDESHYGAWLFRCAGGDSRRVNSANPLHAKIGDIAGVIAAAEDFYRARKREALFRIPSMIDTAVDRALDQRGYRVEGETLTLTATLEERPAEKDASILVMPQPSAEWLAAMARLQNQTTVQHDIYRRVVASITLPAAFGACRIEGEFVSLGFVVLSNDLMVFESVVTDSRHRGQGYAQRVLAKLLDWGWAQGARSACLQVVAANTPAITLYRRLGFTTEPYRYHYRRQAGAYSTR